MPSPEQLDAQVLAQPTLPKARQWMDWLRYHHDHLPAHPGWARGVRDTLLGLHYTIAISARRLRKNPTWDFQGTMTDDTAPLEHPAQAILANFQSINPKDLPPRFQPVLDCLFGALRQQIRLAREIDRMQRTGQIDVDVYFNEKAGIAEEQ